MSLEKSSISRLPNTPNFFFNWHFLIFRFVRIFFLFFLNWYSYNFKSYNYICNYLFKFNFRRNIFKKSFRSFYIINLTRRRTRKLTRIMYLLHFFILQKNTFLILFIRFFFLKRRLYRKLKSKKLYRYYYIMIYKSKKSLTEKLLIL